MNTLPMVLSLVVKDVLGGFDSLLVDGLPERCRFLVANTPDLKREAGRLVRRVYESKGYSVARSCSPNEWTDVYDANPDTVTFLAEYGGQFVATLRVIPDSPVGLPMDDVFPERLDALRRAGRRPCEIASMAFLEADGVGAREILFVLFRLAYLAARHVVGGTDFVASVMAHHRAFYRRMLLFDEVDRETRIGPKSGCPVSFVRLNLETAEERYARHYGDLAGGRNLHAFFVNERGAELIEWIRAQRVQSAAEEGWERADIGCEPTGAGLPFCAQADAPLATEAAVPATVQPLQALFAESV